MLDLSQDGLNQNGCGHALRSYLTISPRRRLPLTPQQQYSPLHSEIVLKRRLGACALRDLTLLRWTRSKRHDEETEAETQASKRNVETNGHVKRIERERASEAPL